MSLKKYKHITNTSCVVVWYHLKKNKFYYLIQKRGLKMKRGGGNLAIGGGMIEDDRDMSLQYGAVREIMEESQIKFKNTKIYFYSFIMTYVNPFFYLSSRILRT